MGRWLSLSLFLIVAIGFILHCDLEIPKFLGWVGKLPGDIVIKKKGVVFYFPITTSLVVSFVCSFLLSILGIGKR